MLLARNRFECPPPKRKRPRTWLAESGEIAAEAITFRGSYFEEDGVRDEEDLKPLW
jgi:hypothetical protein